MHRSLIVFLGSVLLLLLPGSAWAGGPDKASKFDFLSPTERTRLEQVERIDVVVEPLDTSKVALDLAAACRELPNQTKRLHALLPPKPAPLEVLSQEHERSKRQLDGQIELLRGFTGVATIAAEDLAQATEAITRLAAVGRDISQLCEAVQLDEVHAGEMAVLRAVFADEAVVITRYQQLLAKRGLIDLIISYLSPGANQAKVGAQIAEKIQPDAGGTPQGMGMASSLGSIAQTGFEGLAEFLIDRAKEEALNYLREQLIEQICGHDPAYFVPKTCEVLGGLDGSMAISAIGASLHAAVVDDLTMMADRLLVLAWVRSPSVAYAGTALRVFLPLFEHAEQRGNPLAYAASIYSSAALDCERVASKEPKPGTSDDWREGDRACARTMAVLRTSSALVRATTRNVAGGKVTSDALSFIAVGVLLDFERMFNEMPDEARELVKARIGAPKGVTWGPKAKLQVSSEALASLNGILGKSVDLLTNLNSQIRSLEDLQRQKVFSDGASKQDMLAIARQTAAALAEIGGMVEEVASSFRQAKGDDAAASRVGGVLASPDAATKDAAPELGEELLASALENTDQLVSAAQALSNQDWAAAALALSDVIAELVEKQASKEEATKLGESLEALRKYLPLFIEIANAESSADVNAALQAAFPAGGYKLKYRQRTVSLNAFLGGYGGGVYQLSTRQLGPEFGMFAPIGVQYSGPLRRKREDKKPWHMGVFVAVVDLGAITTSKWLEASTPDAPTDGTITTVDEPSNFNIAGLVSPGAYWTIGVASSPFTFGLGASVNPFSQLQSDEVYAAGELVDSTQRYLSTLRFGAFVAVDITMVAFGLNGRK